MSELIDQTLWCRDCGHSWDIRVKSSLLPENKPTETKYNEEIIACPECGALSLQRIQVGIKDGEER